MEGLEPNRIEPSMAVCDVDGNKIGTVAQVYDRASLGQAAGTGTTTGAGAPHDEEYLEVKTGFFGLGKHLFIPRSAVHDAAENCVFLAIRKNQLDEQGWHRRPPSLDRQEPAATIVTPTQQAVAAPATETATAGPVADTWEHARVGEGSRTAA